MIFLLPFLMLTPTHVTDGDTFRAGSLVVRIHGMDAPETRQPFGIESKQFAFCELSKQVAVVPVGRDKYGRLVCRVPGVDYRLVNAGLAWQFRRYDRSASFFAAELDAKEAKRGLWSGDAVAPWEWRKRWATW